MASERIGVTCIHCGASWTDIIAAYPRHTKGCVVCCSRRWPDRDNQRVRHRAQPRPLHIHRITTEDAP